MIAIECDKCMDGKTCLLHEDAPTRCPNCGQDTEAEEWVIERPKHLKDLWKIERHAGCPQAQS